MSLDAKATRLVTRVFKNNGFALRPATLSSFKEYLMWEINSSPSPPSPSDLDQELTDLILKLVACVKKTNTGSSLVEPSTAHSIVESLKAGVEDAGQSQAVLNAKQGHYDSTFIEFFDAFSLPYPSYHPTRKAYVPIYHTGSTSGSISAPPRHIIGRGQDKLTMALDRHTLVSQRVNRTPLAESLTPIEALLGLSGRRTVLGMLSEADDKVWQLEDINSSVQLDFSLIDPSVSSGTIDPVYFNEYSLAVVQGEYLHGNLTPAFFASPPPESRSVTLRAMPQLAHFSQPPSLDLERKYQLARSLLSSERVDDVIAIFSDVHLDDPSIMRRLGLAFDEFETSSRPPSVIVLMGDFLSPTIAGVSQTIDPYIFSTYASQLATLLDSHPGIAQNSLFAFLPGKNDGGADPALPMRGIPQYLTTALRQRLPHTVFPSNPARLLFFGVELVMLRSSLSSRLSAGALVPSSGTQEDKAMRVVRTVCDQAHLSPLHPLKQPVIWGYDYSLFLNPLPHILILAETGLSYFDITYSETLCANPGSFATEGTFVEIYPGKMKAVRRDTLPSTSQANV